MATQVLAGDALQLAGRGSWFVANENELAALQTRVDKRDLCVTAPLRGDSDPGIQGDALAFEQRCLMMGHEMLLGLLRRERVEVARRAALLYPQQMCWSWLDDASVTLDFWLPAGSFATSVVRELITPLEQMDIPD